MSSSELVIVAGEDFCNDELSSTASVMRKDYLKDKEEEELELGLCLGGKKKVVVKPYGSVDYCRILTAEDFSSPSSMVRAQFPSNRPRPPYSSCSSSSGSSSSSLLMVVGVQGSSKNTTVDDDSTASVAVTAKQLVGWPPVRTYRKNSLVNQTSKRTNSSSSENNPDAIQHKKPFVVSQAPRTHHNIIEEGAIFHGRKKVIPHLVKVNMDGDPIGRKVDLNSYSSYTTLCIALEDMFQKISEPRRTSARVTNASKLLDGSSAFVLTYEDKDEDWMLVGDVPWRMFLTTVRRLRIMRRSEANGTC